ncbi:GMC oxidoreductase-domain-containing protein, partial [Sordaria brevicollis]
MRTRRAQALLLAQSVTAVVATQPRDNSYDYIVVGGGISGLVVANRLTEDKKVSVLVIERGDFDDKPEAIIPYYANGLDVDVLISPTSAPNPQLNNDTFSVAVPAVVGGGSVVNGMGYLRGSREDYDVWKALGNPGWGWDDLLPYFRKSTTFTPPTPEAVNEFNITWNPSAYDNGPLHVHIPSFQYPDVPTLWDAFGSQDDVPVRAGENAGNGPGAYWLPSTIDGRDMTRSTARKAYYDPVNGTRPNLHLLTGHMAREILLTGSGPALTANGVHVVSRANNSTRRVYARKEVILAAGAIQTPQLLQVSGIGPSSVLKAAGIRVKRDLPAVGANFQDHATTILIFSLNNQSFPNPDTLTANSTYFEAAWAEYLANLTGPISAAPASSAILFGLPHLNSSAAASATASKLLTLSSTETLSYLPSIYSSTPSLFRGFRLQCSLLAKSFVSLNSSIVAHSMPGNGFMPAPLLKP